MNANYIGIIVCSMILVVLNIFEIAIVLFMKKSMRKIIKQMISGDSHLLKICHLQGLRLDDFEKRIKALEEKKQ